MDSGQSDQTQRRVHRRRVFYIPGYDPIAPRRYRELYRKEATLQAEISGYGIELSPGPDGGPFGWQVAAAMDGAAVESRIEVLAWSDIVRDSMSPSIPATYLQMLATAWTYLTSGTLRRLFLLRKGPVIAALYPVAMLLAQLFLALLAALFAARIVGGALRLLPLSGAIFEAIVSGLSLAAALAVAVAALRWFKARDNHLYAYYLMHDYAHSARLGGAYPPELELRLAAFGDRIAAALESDADEVLVVGHSSGAHLGVSILSDLLREGRVPRDGPALGLLTLGQVMPMVSFLPKAHRLRADLHFLSARTELTWVDVSAPGDGCAFALCDPVAVSGVAPEGKIWPLVISAAFTRTLSEARWAALRWRFFRLHFQYLCAFDRPGDYDYFRITAGPLTLAERFANRPASLSRIDVPVSKHTSLRAA